MFDGEVADTVLMCGWQMVAMGRIGKLRDDRGDPNLLQIARATRRPSEAKVHEIGPTEVSLREILRERSDRAPIEGVDERGF